MMRPKTKPRQTPSTASVFSSENRNSSNLSTPVPVTTIPDDLASNEITNESRIRFLKGQLISLERRMINLQKLAEAQRRGLLDVQHQLPDFKINEALVRESNHCSETSSFDADSLELESDLAELQHSLQTRETIDYQLLESIRRALLKRSLKPRSASASSILPPKILIRCLPQTFQDRARLLMQDNPNCATEIRNLLVDVVREMQRDRD